MRKIRKVKRKILKFNKQILVTTLSMMLVVAGAFGIGSLMQVKAATTPDHAKSLTDNHDGTYTLGLSVTGESEKQVNKVNVVVVLDVSGSMDYGTDYVQDNQGGYGYDSTNDEYFFLYSRSGYGMNATYTRIANNKVSGTVYYINNGYYSEYNGTRYTSEETRMTAAQDAVNTLAQSLLSNNTQANPDIIELSLVKFSTVASNALSTQKTTSYTTISNAVNALSADGGTNWEDALATAKNINFGDNDTTYIIFVSDGDPTYRMTKDGGNNSGENASHTSDGKTYYGSGNSDNNGKNYRQAAIVAKSLVDSSYKFYAIGVYGDVARMNNLVNYAYTGNDDTTPSANYYYNASDTSEFQQAMRDILQKIEIAGFGEVSISDGTTDSVEVSSGGLKDGLIDVDTNSYKYWLSFPVTVNGENLTSQVEYITNIQKGTGDNDYILTAKDGTTYNVTRVPAYEIDEYGQTTDTVIPNVFKFEWVKDVPNPLHGTTNPPEAEFKDSTYSVDWNLASLGVLLNGVTYTVTFDVFPSQVTLDLIADLKNNKVKYADLDDSIKAYLTEDYKIRTNTTATLKYDDTRDEAGIQTTNFVNPNPVSSLTAESLSIAKEWVNELPDDNRDRSDIQLNVNRDSKTQYQVDLNDDNDWENSVFISVGIITINNETGAVSVKTSGRDYSFAETQDIAYHWELTAPTVHPMLINSELTMLLLCNGEPAATSVCNGKPEGMSDTANHYTDGEGHEFFKIGDSYYVVDNSVAELTATNNRRSYLDLTKVVTGSDAPEDALFTFNIVINDANGDDVWYSVEDADGNVIIDLDTNGTDELPALKPSDVLTNIEYHQADGTVTYKYKGTDYTVKYAYTDDDGFYHYYNGFFYANSGSTIEVKMMADWNLRFTNLPSDTTYTITELTDEDNFETGFVFKSANDQTDSPIYSGEISEANTAYKVTYTNEYVLTHVDATKVWADNEDQDGLRPETIDINLTGINPTTKEVVIEKTITLDGEIDYEDEDETIVVTNGETDSWRATFNDLPVYLSDGVTKIEYSVTETETDVIAGEDTAETYAYIIAGDAEGGYIITNEHTPETTDVEGSKTWSDGDDQDGLRPESITINLLADGTKIDSATVTEDDDWAWSFTDLPKYRDGGVEIVYSITEDTVSGYTTTVSGFNVTNAYTPETTDVEGAKTWSDSDDQDGLRPESITINLLADGTKIDSATVTEEDDWAWSFTDLPKYRDGGVEIAYTITEDTVSGYTTTVSGFNVTNSYTPETVDVEGSKTWSDSDDQDGLRPESITINLLADGTKIDTATVTEDDDWAWSFTDLPKYRDGGVEIVYSITEDTVEDYATTVNGYNVTNAYTPETTDVEGSKTWSDSDDQDGLRPESITINLLADGTKIDSATVTEDDDWAWSFTDLPKYRDGGVEIVYTITEDTVSGYTTTISGFDVTNAYTPETTDVEGSKTWSDSDDQDGLRPESITINLLADGTKIDSATVTEDDDWAWSFTDLPKYRDGGVEIVYTITEDTVSGYTTTVSGFNVTNAYTPETTDVEGSKTWSDSDDQDGLRPESITINLLADGTKIDSATVTEDDDWAWSFADLPKYRDGGVEIVYSITEDTVSGYTTTVNGYNVTNAYTPETTDVEGSKTWSDSDDQDGLRPESITINLLADGTKIDTATVTEDDDWAWSFTDLPKYRDGGVEIVYTITEGAVEGYTTTVSGFNVTNTYAPETTDVEGSKTWSDSDDQDGLRPESITINLLADGTKIDSATVTEDDDWAWSFTDLPKYRDGGVEIVYSITEDTVSGYTTTVSGYNVTNAYTPETTDVEGSKTWSDSNDQDGLRPESITINLLADGTKIDSATVTEDDDWAWSFTDLPKYRDGGVEIVYTVTEDTVSGYTTTVSGFDVTNSYTPETTDVEGSKTWSDGDDQDGLRPESITINLLADGTKIDSATVTEDDDWAWSFTDLPKYRDGGVEIVYSITEDTVSGYTTTVNGYNVTNAYTPETTDVEGSKTWSDSDDQDGLRPESITINLLADGTKIDTATVTEDDDWAWSFTDLPKYRDGGVEIVYTITEDTVSGYTTTVSGYNVTNTYSPETVDVEGSKTWADNNDQDGLRPESITINLLADGTKIDSATVKEGDDWAWSFTDLPKYRDGGVEITYTITEDTVSGYTTTVSGYNVTNSYTPETTEVSGTKTWSDSDNQDGLRTASVTINLLADGTKVSSTTASESTKWAYSFTGLPKYRDGGVEIVYSVTEDTVSGYTTTVSGYNVTNTHTPETTAVIGKKSWVDANNNDNLRPESITVNLLADGTKIDSTSVTAGENGNWEYSFTGLPKYRDGGVEIIYTVTEDAVEGYTQSYDEENKYIIVNTHTLNELEITADKVWKDNNNQDGLRASEVQVKLVAMVGEDEINVFEGAEVDNSIITLSDENNWTYTWSELKEYYKGVQISYSVKEITNVSGYSVSYSNEEDSNVFVITNTHVPKTIDISGAKTWDDADDNDGLRPESITINLLADGTKIDSATVTEDDDWAYAFNDLPKYRDGGVEIVYTITEDTVEGYESTVSGYNVTNSYTPETVSFNIVKIWNDSEDNDGLRPESITVRLLANDVEVAKTVISADENGDWKYSFTGFNKYANGIAIDYKIVEDEVLGYTKDISLVDETTNSYEITNTHEIETRDITVTKIWDDYDDISELRPEEITVDLLADDVVTATITISKDDNWVKTIYGLPKYRDGGIDIVYTIFEHEIAEYDVTYNYNGDEFTITNKHELGKGGGGDPEVLPPQTGVSNASKRESNYLVYIALLLLNIVNMCYVKKWRF